MAKITVTEKFMETMKEKRMTETSLAPLIGLSQQNFSHRKRGVVDWRLTEAFKILEIFEVEPCEIARFFVGNLRG